MIIFRYWLLNEFPSGDTSHIITRHVQISIIGKKKQRTTVWQLRSNAFQWAEKIEEKKHWNDKKREQKSSLILFNYFAFPLCWLTTKFGTQSLSRSLKNLSKVRCATISRAFHYLKAFIAVNYISIIEMCNKVPSSPNATISPLIVSFFLCTTK